MKWFKKMLWRWSQDGRDLEEDHAVTSISSKRSRVIARRDRDEIELPDGGLNIQVKQAIGGKIVVFRNYDERNDRNLYTTYLINDSENFEENLGKIITLESMKL
jgi:hypothetical protein